jgi:hypothetical protein
MTGSLVETELGLQGMISVYPTDWNQFVVPAEQATGTSLPPNVPVTTARTITDPHGARRHMAHLLWTQPKIKRMFDLSHTALSNSLICSFELVDL